MKEYYKIGEISKIYNIGKDSLMYYEKLGILNPIRDDNRYRLYSISDIWRLNLIKELRALNFSMKKIKQYIDNRSVYSTKELLEEEIGILDYKIAKFQKRKEEAQERINSINREFNSEKFLEIELLNIPQRKAIILNGNVKRDEEVDFLVKKLHKNFEEKFNILGNNNIGSIFSLDKIRKGEYDYYNSVFCFIDDQNDIDYSNMSFDSGMYLCCSYNGDYSNSKAIINLMFEYIEKNNLRILSSPLEIYKIDIHETAIRNEFVTEIQMEVEYTSNKI